MVAQIIKHHWPNMIDLHNYPPACKVSSKVINWNVLNAKVSIIIQYFENLQADSLNTIKSELKKITHMQILKKLNLQLTKEEINKLSNSDSKTVYMFLERLKNSVCKVEHEKRYIMVKGDMVQITEGIPIKAQLVRRWRLF